MITPYKTTCSAFGCKRYTRTLGQYGFYLCKEHWFLIPKRLRSLHNKAYRIAQKESTDKNWRKAIRLWRKCVKAANEAQFGIG